MMIFIFGLLFNTNVFALEQEAFCDPKLLFPTISNQSIELSKKVQATLGVSPAFCRLYKGPTDDSEDEELKKIVNDLVKKDKSKDISEDLHKTTLKVMERVAMKKLWSQISEPTKIKLYFSKECEKAQLNKWPYLDNTKNYFKGDLVKEERILKNIQQLCSNGKSFEGLAPFLTKDVVNESMRILASLYPQNFKQIKEFTCDGFDKTAKDAFKEEKYDYFILGKEDVAGREEFVGWMKKLADYHTKTNYYSASIEEKVDELYQFQNRGKASYEVISVEEMDAVEVYTRESFQTINGCLRMGSCDKKTEKQIELISSALKKIKDANPEGISHLLFRGVENLPKSKREQIKNAIDSGEAMVLDKAFTSTSANGKEANFYAGRGEEGYRFIIKSKSCVGIADIAKVKSEDEFLCPPNLSYKIRKTEIPSVLILEEVE